MLHSFSPASGEYPYAGLALKNSALYGATNQAGASGDGTVFGLVP